MKTVTNKKYETKNLNAKLLKICAIFFMVISNSILGNIVEESGFTSLSVGIIVFQLFRNFRKIGNIFLICCYIYYLVDSVSFKFGKVFSLVFNSLFFSLLSLLISFILGIDLTYDIFIKLLFPIAFELNLFVCCIILYYFSHPYLNLFFGKIGNKNLNIFSVIVFVKKLRFCKKTVIRFFDFAN